MLVTSAALFFAPSGWHPASANATAAKSGATLFLKFNFIKTSLKKYVHIKGANRDAARAYGIQTKPGGHFRPQRGKSEAWLLRR
jgi:ectoine hydroxylase-related dioxygenase (phytanoyl-CoA dioxygenase family)